MCPHTHAHTHRALLQTQNRIPGLKNVPHSVKTEWPYDSLPLRAQARAHTHTHSYLLLFPLLTNYYGDQLKPKVWSQHAHTHTHFHFASIFTLTQTFPRKLLCLLHPVILPVHDVIAGRRCGSQQSQCCTPHHCSSTTACLHDIDSLQCAACQRDRKGGREREGEERRRMPRGRSGERKMNEIRMNHRK